MNKSFFKRVTAFAVASFLAFGMITFLPEKYLPQTGIISAAEESNLYIKNTEQINPDTIITINWLYVNDNSFGKMNIDVHNSENFIRNGDEQLCIYIYGIVNGSNTYKKIGTVHSTSFSSSTYSFYLDGVDGVSPILTYSDIYFNLGYEYSDSNGKKSFVSCTKVYTSTKQTDEDNDNDNNDNIITSGQCGDNAYWKLTNDGTLTISGTGSIYSYNSYTNFGGEDYTTAPWWTYRKQIFSIVVESGITKITDYAFHYLNYTENITFDEGISTIGGYNFCCGKNLKKVTIPKSVTYIGKITCWGSSINNQLTFYGYNGSYAENYAEENKIPFVTLDKWDSDDNSEKKEDIEIDVRLLNNDGNLVDTVEYKRGEFNLRFIEVTVHNNTAEDLITDSEKNSETSVYATIYVDNGGLFSTEAFSMDVKRNDSETKIIPIDLISNFDKSPTFLLGNNVGIEIDYSCSIDGYDKYASTTRVNIPCTSDVFNIINGEFNDIVDCDFYDLLTTYMWTENLSFWYHYNNFWKSHNIKESCNKGTCFGFSSTLSALRYTDQVKSFFQYLHISDINEDTALGNLNFRQIIQIMQTIQFDVTIRKEINDEYHLNNLTNLVTEVKNIPPNDMKHMIIWVQSKDEAHIVTPYKIAQVSESQYEIYVYDSNMPYRNKKIILDLNSNSWEYEIESGKIWGSREGGLITFCCENFTACLKRIADNSTKKLNEDENGQEYASLLISSNNYTIADTAKLPVDVIPIETIAGIDTFSNQYNKMFYVLPNEYTIYSNDKNINFVYCLSDTAITANLNTNAEITLNVSDDDIDDTYAMVTGNNGDRISLCLEHDTTIDRDFTNIKFDGIMYDTLKIQETDDGMNVTGLKSGSFEIVATDGTVTTKTIDNVPENAQVTVIVYNDSTGDVLVDSSKNSYLNEISIDAIELTDFAYNKTKYIVTVPYGTTAIPTVTATPSNANATVSIKQATSLIGTEAERTATITVTAEGGITQTIYTVTFNLDAHTHTLENGYTSDETGHWKNCSDCDDKVDFSPHTEDSGMITTEPTEFNEGIKTFKCTVCDRITRTENISKLDHLHNLEMIYSKDETGHWYACTGCDNKVNFSTHTYDSGIINIFPTETAEGIKTYTCTVCKYEFITTLSKIEHTHDFDNFYSSDKSGHWYACNECDEKIDFAAHIEDVGIITTEPTKEKEGIKTYKCIDCGYTIRTEIIPRLEHIHTLATEYSFDETGHWFACIDCNEKVHLAVHDEDNVVITIEPTEISMGIKTFKCSVCGYVTRTENISAITPNHTHSFNSNWKSDITSHWHECNCGVTFDVANHISDSGKITVQSTATSNGIRTYSCSVCGYVIRTETISTTGNNNYPSSSTYPVGTPSTTITPTNSINATTFNVKIENKITGETNKAKATRTDENVTVDVGKENNGYYANIYTTDGNWLDSVKIKSGKAKFIVQNDIDFYIVIDRDSHLEYEDVSSSAGIYETDNNSQAPLCMIAIIIAAVGFSSIITVKRFAKKKH